jgi:nicotinate-nucleotide adenylyltransferase
MNIAVLGGTFDPPHIWHYWIAQQILDYIRGMDQVWLMPDYSNAFKDVIASPGDRYNMLQYVQTGRIRVSNIALKEPGTTYTVSVVKTLSEDYINRYFWVVGSDVLSDFSKWRDYQKLTKMIQFLVIPRKDFPINKLPEGFRRIEGNLMLSNVSSTLIRERIKRGMSIKGLVFPEVEEYINKNNLYK